jgi:hypothetical protein
VAGIAAKLLFNVSYQRANHHVHTPSAALAGE